MNRKKPHNYMLNNLAPVLYPLMSYLRTPLIKKLKEDNTINTNQYVLTENRCCQINFFFFLLMRLQI